MEYYSLVPLLSHNAFINMTIGGRGIGKTFSCKELVIRKYVKKGDQFIYVRRREKELDRVKGILFTDLMVEGKSQNRKIRCEGDQYLINFPPDEEYEKERWEICGYAIALSCADDYKSASFHRVKWIIFDEFLFEEKQGKKYLKNEVQVFFGFLETVIRQRRDVRVIMLANAISLINPYMLYFGFDKKYTECDHNFYTTKDKNVCMEIVQTPEDFKTMKKHSALGKISEGTKFYDSSYDNTFLLDNTVFLHKLPKQSKLRYLLTLKYHGQYYGLWVDYKEAVMYVSEHYYSNYPLIYSFELEDHDQDTHHVGYNFRNGYLKQIVEWYQKGKLYCDSYRSKGFLEALLFHKL